MLDSIYFTDPDTYQEAAEEVFAADGLLAQSLPNFEPRANQLVMAQKVGHCLAHGNALAGSQANLLAVEAGTGIGKTLAYLVPAILSGQKMVVSTNTLNLQDQILDKEIPFIKKHIAPTLDALCVKGRQNYLCHYRYHQFLANPQLKLFADEDMLRDLADWVEATETGDRAELSWLADDAQLWQSISATTSQCLGMHCPDGQYCFINTLRKKAGKAQLLIVNHHLFFSDLALRRFGHAEVLPRYESVIFDEAHHLENVATRYFGTTFSIYQVLDLVKDIETSAQADLNGKDKERITQTARALARQADQFTSIFPKERGRFPLFDFIERADFWEKERQTLFDHLLILIRHLGEVLVVAESWQGLLRRTEELVNSFVTITEEQEANSVYWYERREKTVVLSASPIDVAEELNEFLYEQAKSVIFTSATLTTGGNFAYFKDRLGLPDDLNTMLLDTPFDYKARTRLYIPERSFPEPSNGAFYHQAPERIEQLILAAEGRTLVLFTSFNSMRKAAEYLEERLPFPVYVQGQGSKTALLQQFRQETHSVLLAVASFWEGVDVAGEALSCVIIDKLPFEVPSDPVIMARMERIRQSGKNPFFDFQVPRAILTLRQGVGRLMRTSTDRGVLAILDVRLLTKSYGKLFLKSMPPSPVINDIAAVERFFLEDQSP